MKRVLIASICAAAAAAFPAWAGAATLKGVVVAKSSSRGTIAVATARGAVRTLHVRSLVRPGARITATGVRRADGTYKASRVAVRGRAHHALFRGVVAARTSRRLLLSAGGSMIVLHARRGRTLAAVGHDKPGVGTEVEVEVEIAENGDLEDENEDAVAEHGFVEIEGRVAGTGPTTIQVRTEGGMTVTVNVPSNVHVHVAVGDEIELTASVQGTTLTLVKVETEDEDDGGDD